MVSSLTAELLTMTNEPLNSVVMLFSMFNGFRSQSSVVKLKICSIFDLVIFSCRNPNVSALAVKILGPIEIFT